MSGWGSRSKAAWGPGTLRPAAVASLVTPLGELFVAATEDGVVASSFEERHFIEEVMGAGYEAVVFGAPPEAAEIAQAAKNELSLFFAGALTAFTVPIVLTGRTDFATRVLEEVAHRIGFAETATYAEVGERAGRPRAARAVGNTLATCPFSVIVPCHRVVHAGKRDHNEERSSQRFPRRKAWLLRFEAERAREWHEEA